jgi:hypothetical protein
MDQAHAPTDLHIPQQNAQLVVEGVRDQHAEPFPKGRDVHPGTVRVGYLVQAPGPKGKTKGA